MRGGSPQDIAEAMGPSPRRGMRTSPGSAVGCVSAWKEETSGVETGQGR